MYFVKMNYLIVIIHRVNEFSVPKETPGDTLRSHLNVFFYEVKVGSRTVNAV